MADSITECALKTFEELSLVTILMLKTTSRCLKQQLTAIRKNIAINRLHRLSKNTKMRPAMTDAGWSSLVARRAHNPKV
ncbi:MAG: hypothetical protein NWQ30_00365, partial [Alishewanella sp.]|nr:hypothetical protein [Alishewanella sp.]